MASQRFCLRWNNHQTNLLSVFDQLLHAETFTDVTLAVEGQYLKAHKMVLSACSPYFQAIFTNHPEKHPIVILKDVPYADMKSLLDFMYRGEVSVDQERLTAFLRVAESLRIKGLTEVNDEKSSPPASNTNASSNNSNNSSSQTPQQQQQQQQPMTPPPQLHRINPYLLQQQQQQQRQQQQAENAQRNSGTQGGQQAQSMAMSNPLLGSALSGPKRKRGRPRKLSGSDMGEDYEDMDRENLVQGSPEILEVRMGTEGFSTPGNEGSDENGVSRSIHDGEDSSNDVIETSEASHRKSASTPQPAASTSKSGSPRKDENTSEYSNQDNKKTQLLPPIIPNLGLLFANKTLESVPGSNLHSIKIRVNPLMQQQATNLIKMRTNNNNVNSNSDNPTQSAQDLTQPPTSSTQITSSPLSEYHQNNITVPIITSVSSLANGNQTPTNSSQYQATSSCQDNNSPSSRQPLRRRIRRKGGAPDDQAEQLTEMSVRGLNLFRYASISEGVYKCTECAKDNVQKTFKNKYSFQRHAFLYHEGTQRKVFPCPICSKEFSRPDKMKNHMKTTHDCFVSKDSKNTFPLNFLMESSGGGDGMSQNNGPIIMHQKYDNENQQQLQQQQQQQHANATLEYLRQQSAENSLQLQMIGLNSALSLTMPKLESLLPTTQ